MRWNGPMKKKQVHPTLEHHRRGAAGRLAFNDLASDPFLHFALPVYPLLDCVFVTGISINCDFPEAMAASTIPLISAFDVTFCAVTPVDLAKNWKLTCESRISIAKKPCF